MAQTMPVHPACPMSLEEYLEYIAEQVDLTDQESVLCSADALAALALDETLLATHVNDELRHWTDFQPGNAYSAQTLTLGGGRDFSVRANMWLPPSPSDDGWEDHLYAYGLAHDHNFSFLTVGYYGSGYQTRIYEYDHDDVIGYPGEPVDLQFLERTSLPKGKVMYYRASTDVHTQEHPDEFSVSVNLLIVGAGVRKANQYTFDLETSTVSGYVQNVGTGRVMLAYLARFFGNDRTAGLLDELSQTHPHPRLRWTAADSLATLDPARAAEVVERAASDLHPYVRMRAAAELEPLRT